MGKPQMPTPPSPKDAPHEKIFGLQIFGLQCEYCGTLSNASSGLKCSTCGAPLKPGKIAGNLSE